MLTIRVISGIEDNTSEMVKEVSTVMLRPARETARQLPCLTYFEEGKAVEDIYYGTIYVMNENGKTIAKYELLHLDAVIALTGDGAIVTK